MAGDQAAVRHAELVQPRATGQDVVARRDAERDRVEPGEPAGPRGIVAQRERQRPVRVGQSDAAQYAVLDELDVDLEPSTRTYQSRLAPTSETGT